jgi:carbamoyltransferase
MVFRPFAPAVCVEDVKDYFEFEGDSPYMLKICNVVSDKIPSVTHVDGTSRIQTVVREDNQDYYDLIRSFENYSGVPVILNTSLNLAGEPIVENS